jgi:hypothetical protein
MASTEAESELTPWCTRSFTGTVTATVTTTVWVVTCVHNNTTNCWTDTFAAFAACGTNLDVLMLFVTDYTD